MEFFALFFLAVIVEGITEQLKQAFPVISDKTGIILAITWVLGIGGCLAFGVDMFALFHVEARVPWAGEVLTGIAIARGANYMYDLIGKFTDGGFDNGRRN